ncbi:hypothetical protein [Agarilytica rhodophyticola]|nr:hypothetical protein [Agarilytica rhodophyticola]
MIEFINYVAVSGDAVTTEGVVAAIAMGLLCWRESKLQRLKKEQ